ncbi:hypothetical protein Leryth_003252 [Lithospermum erythrorhizon]|nr:hypothetical protein Leryth_003252 [Lithospermum erythrorhizon]
MTGRLSGCFAYYGAKCQPCFNMIPSFYEDSLTIGAIVLSKRCKCDGKTVKDAGGTAVILLNTDVHGYSVRPDIYTLPVVRMSYNASQNILAYLNSTSDPKATISSFKGTIIGDKDAPSVTHFSSRGPSIESPGILKPDIVAPGVGILAAWPRSVEGNNNTKSDL